MRAHEDLDLVEKARQRSKFSTDLLEQAQQVHTLKQKMLRTDSMTCIKKKHQEKHHGLPGSDFASLSALASPDACKSSPQSPLRESLAAP